MSEPDPATPTAAASIAAAYDEAMMLDVQLQLALEVQARWTQTGNEHRAKGTITGFDAHTVTVRLAEAVTAAWGDSYDAGFEIRLPRPLSVRWSPQNGAFPLR